MLTLWCKMIENMNRAADDDFLRAWLAVDFSCFLAPTTSLSILPRCFPAILNTNVIKDSKICDFVVDQLRLAFMGFGEKKKAVCCCVFHLVVSTNTIFNNFLFVHSFIVNHTLPFCFLDALVISDNGTQMDLPHSPTRHGPGPPPTNGCLPSTCNADEALSSFLGGQLHQ